MTWNTSDAAGYMYSVQLYGGRLAAEDVDAVKFLYTSGNIESGEIVMYGVANGS